MSGKLRKPKGHFQETVRRLAQEAVYTLYHDIDEDTPEHVNAVQGLEKRFSRTLRGYLSKRARSAGEVLSDISTAPQDGTWFVAVQDGETFPCAWERQETDEGPDREGWYDYFNQSYEAPTHWMRHQPSPPHRPRRRRRSGDEQRHLQIPDLAQGRRGRL